MDLAGGIGLVLVSCAGAMLVGWTGARSRWLLLVFAIPALSVCFGLAGLAIEDASDCYEECTYHWMFFLAAVSFAFACLLTICWYARLRLHHWRERR